MRGRRSSGPSSPIVPRDVRLAPRQLEIRRPRRMRVRAGGLRGCARALAQNWEAGPTDSRRSRRCARGSPTSRTRCPRPSSRRSKRSSHAWERDTGAQMVVLVVPSTKPEPIETYSIRVAEAWKVGRKGQDNGVLFLVAKDDHKMRLEVGYGLEGVLTDVTSRRIIAEDVAPLFRQNQFAAGINAGADRVMSVVGKGEPLPAKPRSEARRPGAASTSERC